MKKALAIGLTVAALAGAGLCWAAEKGDFGGGWMHHRGAGGPGDGGFGMGMGWLLHNPDKAHELGVTDQQLATLKDEAFKREEAMIKARADVELAHLELRHLLEQDTSKADAVNAAVDKVGAARTALEKEKVGGLLKAREILGADTVAKIRAAMREHHRWGKDGEKGACPSDKQGRSSRHEGPGPGDHPQPPEQAPEAP